MRAPQFFAVIAMGSSLALAEAPAQGARVRLPTAGGRIQEWGPTIRVSDVHGTVSVGKLRRVRPDTIEFRSPAGFNIRLPVTDITRLELKHRERGRAFWKGVLIGGAISVVGISGALAYDLYGKDGDGFFTMGAVAVAPTITLGGGAIGFLSARSRWVAVRTP